MPALFSGPPKPPPLPKPAPPTNTPLTAELALMANRQGQNAAVLTPPGGGKKATALTHTLTG